jgi:hypothetical protein
MHIGGEVNAKCQNPGAISGVFDGLENGSGVVIYNPL